jgi:hypothetical protein
MTGCGDSEPPSHDANGEENLSASGQGLNFGSPGTGFLKIGDNHHDLEITRCIVAFGALGGSAVSTQAPDNIKVNFEFSPANWRERPETEGWTETGTVSLRSENPYAQWESGLSQVSDYNLDSLDPASLDIIAVEFSADGRSARGEANFLHVDSIMKGSPSASAGSFEFSCPEP